MGREAAQLMEQAKAGRKSIRKSVIDLDVVTDPNHPAGPDAAAQHRWNRAMGITKDTEADKDSAKQKKLKLADERLLKAHGGYEDWCYHGGILVVELIEALEEESYGLHDMLQAARESAISLSNGNWTRFQEIPRRCVHAIDKDVITTLFSAAEPQWRTLLTTPKKGGTCVFLHIGTEPPSTPIMELLTKLGWFGVAVCPTSPAEGNEDRVQHCELDPFSEEDEHEILKLAARPKDSLIPKPVSFMMAMCDVVWDSDNIDGDANQSDVWKTIDSNTDGNISKKEFKNAQRAGLLPKSVKFKDFDINGDGSISKDEFIQAIKQGHLGEEAMLEQENQAAQKAAPPQNATGYGLLGVTWSPQVRGRLRLLRNLISVALNRLANTGSLVITWHGIPHHPVLMFITAQLRPVFLRVHVLVPEGTRSWETWILAASFKRAEAEETASKGGGGFMFKNFIDNAYRCADLDDALLWTLPYQGLLEEYRLGGGERTMAKGYNELWTEYARKFREMAKELGAPAPDKVEGGPGKMKAKAKRVKGDDAEKDGKVAKGKAKAKAKAGEDGKPGTAGGDGTDASAPGTAGGEGFGGIDPETGLPAEVPPGSAGAGPGADGAAAGALPGIDGVPGGFGAGDKNKGAKGPKMPIFGSGANKYPGVVAKEEAGPPIRRKKLVLSRTLPDLSSSLGCAPGVKVGYPSERAMGESYPIIQRALDHLELRSKIVERIERVDIGWAMKMSQTAKFMTTDEGKRMDGVQIMMPPDPADDTNKPGRARGKEKKAKK